jgi:polyisoprenoid-binding protein YceI
MKHKLLITAAFLLVATLAQAADVIQLGATPKGNKIRIEGTSTIHDWQAESSLIGGTAEVGPDFPLKPGAELKPGPVNAKVTVFIPVPQLKSVEKDGKPYSDKMDNRMYEALKSADNNRITYTLASLVAKEAPKSPDQPYQFEATGELCVAGVTNKVTMPVMMTVLEENKVKFAGTVTVKMSDFKIEAPTISVLGIGMIKTGDDVKLFFEWVAVKKAAPAAR